MNTLSTAQLRLHARAHYSSMRGSVDHPLHESYALHRYTLAYIIQTTRQHDGQVRQSVALWVAIAVHSYGFMQELTARVCVVASIIRFMNLMLCIDIQ
jgi:hypothetical protein